MPEITAIYGAGLFGRCLIRELAAQNIDVAFFIDEYTPATTFEGKPVLRIKDVQNKDQLLLLNSTAYDLKDNLTAQGFTRILQLQELIYRYPRSLIELNRTMWMVKSEQFFDEDKFAWLRRKITEKQSIDLLQKLMDFRMNQSPENFVLADGDTDYFPTGFDPFRGINDLRFVDCGAYTGDTIQALFKRFTRKISWIMALEPDPNNLEKLVKSEFERKLPQHAETEIFVYPLGAYNQEKVCHFTSAANISSITEHSSAQNNVVPVARLDTLLAHTHPNFIKMDVEGAELQALQGARKIIEQSRPNMAVSVYHKAEHLWEIPELIDSYFPEYQFRLRLHGNWGQELTLYCLPPEQDKNND